MINLHLILAFLIKLVFYNILKVMFLVYIYHLLNLIYYKFQVLAVIIIVVVIVDIKATTITKHFKQN